MSESLVKIDEGVFINNNIDEFEQYKLARRRAKREVDLSARVSRLENEIAGLKKIIKDLTVG